MPDYHDEEEEVPWRDDSSPKISDGPSQQVALEVSDPWAFLQGTPKKPINPHPPISRMIPQTGPFFTRLSGKFADQRALVEQGNASGGMTDILSQREREIFTRIFETILSERSTFAPRTAPATSFPSTSLNALFESAVGPQQSGSEISFGPPGMIDRASATASLAMASSLEEYPAALRAAAARAAGLMRPNRSYQLEQLDLRKSISIVGLIRDLNLCETDLALGQWMDDRVFSLIRNGRLETPAEQYPTGSYAYLLAEGMKVLRTAFNDFAGCLSIFERIKKLGAESYVLGCSVDVYNQAIAAKWEAYRDLYKIKELVDEMDINGIQGNDKTVQLLHDIMDDVAAMVYDESNRVAHAMLTGGIADMLNHLNYKADIWNIPRKEKDDPMEKSLNNMSG